MINVVNKYKLTGSEFNCEYIGRPSPLGNPFSHLPNTKAQFSVKDRDEAVSKFEDYLRSNINKDLSITREMKRLYRSWKEHGELTLVCWCAPKACHGDVIKKLLEEKSRKEVRIDETYYRKDEE